MQIRNYKKYLTLKNILITIVALLFIGLITERLINKGTIFGYQIRHVKKSSILSDDQPKPSKTCETVNEEQIKNIMGVKATRSGGTFGDRNEPTFISTCTYKLEDTPFRTITMVVRDTTDNDSAKKQIQSAVARKGSESVDKLGDEATYSDSANQLIVRKGKKIYTVSVSRPGQASTISSKDASVAIANLLVANL